MTKSPVILTYYQVYITFSLINLYCHGCMFRIYSEALSKHEIRRNRRAAERLWKVNKTFRNEHPDLFAVRPYTKETLASQMCLELSQDTLISIVKAFKIAIAEAETNHYWHMRIILDIEPMEVIECLHVFEIYLDSPVTIELNDLQSDAVPFIMNETNEISFPEWFEQSYTHADIFDPENGEVEIQVTTNKIK